MATTYIDANVGKYIDANKAIITLENEKRKHGIYLPIKGTDMVMQLGFFAGYDRKRKVFRTVPFQREFIKKGMSKQPETFAKKVISDYFELAIEQTADVTGGIVTEDYGMTAVTNRYGNSGAACVFDKNIRRKLIRIFRSEKLILLPCSKDEFLFFPMDYFADNLTELVRKANNQMEDSEKTVSDYAYIFNAATADFMMI